MDVSTELKILGITSHFISPCPFAKTHNRCYGIQKMRIMKTANGCNKAYQEELFPSEKL